MAMWSCPHCGTPQEETGRCWVCRRSTVCCATCRHIRTAVAGGLTYCGLDSARRPLRGDETRPCWEMANTVSEQNDRSIPVVPEVAGSLRSIPLSLPVAVAGVGDGTAVGQAGSWTLFPEVDS